MKDYILLGLHITFALFLLLITLIEHGPPTAILTADEAAALGFLLFFVLGLPVLAIAMGTIVISLRAGKWWLNVLAASLLVTFALAVISLWTGILASLSYFSFAIWALVQRLATQNVRNRDPSDSGRGRLWVKNIVLLVAVVVAAGLFAALFLVGV